MIGSGQKFFIGLWMEDRPIVFQLLIEISEFDVVEQKDTETESESDSESDRAGDGVVVFLGFTLGGSRGPGRGFSLLPFTGSRSKEEKKRKAGNVQPSKRLIGFCRIVEVLLVEAGQNTSKAPQET